MSIDQTPASPTDVSQHVIKSQPISGFNPYSAELFLFKP